MDEPFRLVPHTVSTAAHETGDLHVVMNDELAKLEAEVAAAQRTWSGEASGIFEQHWMSFQENGRAAIDDAQRIQSILDASVKTFVATDRV